MSIIFLAFVMAMTLFIASAKYDGFFERRKARRERRNY